MKKIVFIIGMLLMASVTCAEPPTITGTTGTASVVVRTEEPISTGWQDWVHQKAREIERKQQLMRLSHCSSLKTDIQLAVEDVSYNWPSCRMMPAIDKAIAAMNRYWEDAFCVDFLLIEDARNGVNNYQVMRLLKYDLGRLKQYMKCK